MKNFFSKIFKNNNKIVSDKAYDYIKENRRKLISHYFEDKIAIPREERSWAIFMAGSPGAGKTEYSKNLLKAFAPELQKKFVRIDADEIREFLPKTIYNGKNSEEIQKAAVKGVQILFDYASTKNFNLILDGTFSNMYVSQGNIERMLKKNRYISIMFIYQDPLIAWEFTKKREALDGRNVPKNVFKKSFIEAQKNVDEIKKMYPLINLSLMIKNHDSIGIEKYYINTKEIEKILKTRYNEKNVLDKTNKK